MKSNNLVSKLFNFIGYLKSGAGKLEGGGGGGGGGRIDPPLYFY